MEQSNKYIDKDTLWLNHAGNFYDMLKGVSDDEWEQLRNMIKSSNESDKAKRSV